MCGGGIAFDVADVTGLALDAVEERSSFVTRRRASLHDVISKSPA
jgi:hypothetical protein